jgi:hypothetical protein
MPIILATQESEIRKIMVQSQFQGPYPVKTHHNKGLMECIKR